MSPTRRRASFTRCTRATARAIRTCASRTSRSTSSTRGRTTRAPQDATLALALDLLEAAPAPRTTVQSPLAWSSDPAWKLDYANVDRLTPEEIVRRRRAFDRAKDEAKAATDAESRIDANASDA